MPHLPSGVSRYYAGLARSQDPDADPIAAQFVARDQERIILPYESADPIGDSRYLVTQRLVHHYRDRALLLVSDRCATYCRYCFRRHFTGNGGGQITPPQLEAACEYLTRTPAIREVLLSGGDPLMLSDQDLGRVISRLLSVDPGYVLRVCTRIPVVHPARVTEDLASLLGSAGSVWAVIHTNHPRELTDQFRAAVKRLMRAGVAVLNQSVLLRGVNDNADTLEELFRGLVKAGVKPYYLFQGDLAAGTSHFRVSIEKGISLMRELRSRLSGMALPTYAVDVPGGGKVPVESSLLRVEADAYVLRGPDDGEYRYPREE
ncbi:MAG TPA: KamA family radical SAM protein [Spirochaetia bacterium]|nr:KamA family radical SAM protein [Spirochaetia bacterium]